MIDEGVYKTNRRPFHVIGQIKDARFGEKEALILGAWVAPVVSCPTVDLLDTANRFTS